MLKAIRNRCVLNMTMSEVHRSSAGRLFHSRAPATAKARSPKVSLVLGMTRSQAVADLSVALIEGVKLAAIILLGKEVSDRSATCRQADIVCRLFSVLSAASVTQLMQV